LLHISID